jgi:DNA-binding NarL/FixJ family response regulator
MEPIAPITDLTPMQRKVLIGLRDGLLNKQIGFTLGIAEPTVKTHVTAILRKLGAKNREQAALLARSLEL